MTPLRVLLPVARGSARLRGPVAQTTPQDGILVVDKPAGPTSFDVVGRVRRALGVKKAGHTGTLDPAATGVLAVCLGEAVKLQQWITDTDKAYEALVVFGFATDTEDAAGREVERGDPAGLDAARVAAGLAGFVGEIDQVPPMYSAVRVGGRRLHEAARRGEEVERAPRRVMVHALELLSFEPPAAGLARARVAVRCGKGTYVRTLATSLGKVLGVPAHLGALRRTLSGPFSIAHALPLDEIEALARDAPEALRARIVRPAEALSGFPIVLVSAAETLALAQGKVLPRIAPGPLCRAIDPGGDLVAVCGPTEGGDGLRPIRVFVQPPGIAGADPVKR
jgi:tRNA pseudouridine55 synthase